MHISAQQMTKKLLFFMLLCTLCILHVLPAVEKQLELNIDLFVQMASIKLDNHCLGVDALKKCQDLLRKTTSPDNRLALKVVRARYHRIMENDPSLAIMVVAPEIVRTGPLKSWVTTSKQQKAATISSEAFPAFTHWDVTDANSGCAIELIRCLMALKAFRASVIAIDNIGRRYQGMPRVLAAECGGDLKVLQKNNSDGLKRYAFALKAMSQEKSYHGGAYSPEQLRVRARINDKLNRTRHNDEIDMYGEGWVLYRDAQRKRRVRQSYVEAYLLYNHIIDKFPDTIWSEAAQCYAVRCLYSLSAQKNAPFIGSGVKAVEQQLKESVKQLTEAKRDRVTRSMYDVMKQTHRNLEILVKEAKRVPVGERASALAKKRAQVYLEVNRLGLYRGEMLLMMAHEAFHTLDPKLAQEYYTQAWDWLSSSEMKGRMFDTHAVPKRARLVAAAPVDETLKTAVFDTFTSSRTPVGAVVNRVTCSWYLDDLRENCALALGFLDFYRGHKEEALVWYKKVVALDKKTAYLSSQGEWNNYRRLKWGAQHGYLYAHPEELKHYTTGKHRFAVLLADFYFVTERFNDAAEIYSRHLSGEFGRLKKKQTDYLNYALAACVYWNGDRRKAYDAYLLVLKTREGTFSESRALYAAGKISKDIDDEEIQKQGESFLKDLVTSGKKNDFVYQGMILYARRLLKTGQNRAGLQLLKKIPQKASDYHALAQYYVNEYAQKIETGKKQ